MRTELKPDTLRIIFDDSSWEHLTPKGERLKHFLGTNYRIVTDCLGFDELFKLPQVKVLKVWFFEEHSPAPSMRYKNAIKAMLKSHLLVDSSSTCDSDSS